MPTPASMRRALVTGGSGELGGAIAHALAAGGYHVIVHANRSLHRAEAVVGEIVASGTRGRGLAAGTIDLF
ncbi:SDR family NAD(P)-dependent oxidoreductase [Rhodanobacter lindaniclasticus]